MPSSSPRQTVTLPASGIEVDLWSPYRYEPSFLLDIRHFASLERELTEEEHRIKWWVNYGLTNWVLKNNTRV
jgi:hypothetical protein